MKKGIIKGVVGIALLVVGFYGLDRSFYYNPPTSILVLVNIIGAIISLITIVAGVIFSAIGISKTIVLLIAVEDRPQSNPMTQKEIIEETLYRR